MDQEVPTYFGPTTQYARGKDDNPIPLNNEEQNSIYNYLVCIFKVFKTTIRNNCDDGVEIGNLIPTNVQSGTKLEKLFSQWKEVLNPVRANRLNKEKHLAIIHGDLNPQNLTWSASYKKFQIIDFEHTGPGYRYADQLKLIFSLLLNIHQRLISTRITPNESNILQKTANEIDRCLCIIYKVSSFVAADLPLNDLLRSIKEINLSESDYLAMLFKQIFSTIFTENQINDNLDCSALLLALQCFALKEINYAIKELEHADFERINEWTEILCNEKDSYDVKQLLSDIGKEGLRRGQGDLQKKDSRKIFNCDTGISGLTCSFFGYCAVSAGLRLDWIRKI